jgi:post-segregation antitoxin (ccd killing protein)
MPKVSVYLPDELYRQARDHHLPISSLAQEAIERALRTADTKRWIEATRGRSVQVKSDFDTERLMDEVRDEFGA